jgi:hypothetical protein
LPHAPQFSGSLAASTQAEPHVVPVGQVKLHCPPWHIGVPPGGAVHFPPHPPQLVGSSSTFAHDEPHTVMPIAHTLPELELELVVLLLLLIVLLLAVLLATPPVPPLPPASTT